MMEEPSDSTLIDQAVRGDESSLIRLYERWADPVYGYLFNNLSGSKVEADDLFQETWLAILEALPRFRGESRVFSWFCGIARRKIADRYRYIERTHSCLKENADESRIENLPDSQPLPDEILRCKDTRDHVLNALGTLPTEYRRVLIARYVEEMSVEELSRLIGKTYKATESLLSRARESLKSALQKERHHE
jgi:RNA polymerase sigma-70 factor, ECF subfamily